MFTKMYSQFRVGVVLRSFLRNGAVAGFQAIRFGEFNFPFDQL